MLFRSHIRSLELYNQVTGAKAFTRLLAGQSGWMDALMAWRQDGGKIVTGKVAIQSSAVTTQAAGPEIEPGLRAILFPLY